MSNDPDLISVEAARTLDGLFRERVRRSPSERAYRELDPQSGHWRDYNWLDVHHQAARIRAALGGSGLDAGDRIAIALPNGVDWVCFDIAALSLGLVVVPLYVHDSAANMAFILSHSGARLLVADSAARWRALLPHWADLIGLEHVWLQHGLDSADSDLVRPGLRSLADLLEDEQISWPAVDPESTATIIYTSGTTGRPKGVMHSHRALLSNAAMTAKVIPPRPDDRFLSCLPLAHAFERTVGYYLPMLGGSQVVYARSIELLPEDLRTQQPTVLLAVPRLYERACAGIEAKVHHRPIQRGMLRMASSFGWRMAEAQQGRGEALTALRRSVWRCLDASVGARAREAFGGRLRVAVSGGAPLSEEVARFLLGLGIPLVEGYGLTEAGPVVTASAVGDYVPGTVGRELEGVELEWSNRGELLVRSAGLMKGYWRDQALTAEAIDRNGWLHTGDIAEMADGRVRIRGRVKDLVVLSTGEKVAAVDIESCLLRDPLFEHALVVGEGKPFIAAVVALKPERWQELAQRLAVDANNPGHASVEAAILRRIEDGLRHLPRHAQARRVYPTLDRWTIENGLLTPTLKTRRTALVSKYANEIANMYSARRGPRQATRTAS